MNAIERIQFFIEEQVVKNHETIPKQVLADLIHLKQLLDAAIILHDGMIENGEEDPEQILAFHQERYEEFSQLKGLKQAIEDVLKPVAKEMSFYVTVQTVKPPYDTEDLVKNCIKGADGISGVLVSEVKKG